MQALFHARGKKTAGAPHSPRRAAEKPVRLPFPAHFLKEREKSGSLSNKWFSALLHGKTAPAALIIGKPSACAGRPRKPPFCEKVVDIWTTLLDNLHVRNTPDPLLRYNGGQFHNAKKDG